MLEFIILYTAYHIDRYMSLLRYIQCSEVLDIDLQLYRSTQKMILYVCLSVRLTFAHGFLHLIVWLPFSKCIQEIRYTLTGLGPWKSAIGNGWNVRARTWPRESRYM